MLTRLHADPKRDLDFLSRALGTAAFRRVWRDALDKLNGMLWSDVLMAHRYLRRHVLLKMDHTTSPQNPFRAYNDQKPIPQTRPLRAS